MAIITGSFTIFFKIVTIQLNVYYAFFGIIGLIIALFVLIKMKKIRYEIDRLINELEKLDG